MMICGVVVFEIILAAKSSFGTHLNNDKQVSSFVVDPCISVNAITKAFYFIDVWASMRWLQWVNMKNKDN